MTDFEDMTPTGGGDPDCNHENGVFFGAEGAPDLYDCKCGFQAFGNKAHERVDDARHIIDPEAADIDVEA